MKIMDIITHVMTLATGILWGVICVNMLSLLRARAKRDAILEQKLNLLVKATNANTKRVKRCTEVIKALDAKQPAAFLPSITIDP